MTSSSNGLLAQVSTAHLVSHLHIMAVPAMLPLLMDRKFNRHPRSIPVSAAHRQPGFSARFFPATPKNPQKLQPSHV